MITVEKFLSYGPAKIRSKLMEEEATSIEDYIDAQICSQSKCLFDGNAITFGIRYEQDRFRQVREILKRYVSGGWRVGLYKVDPTAYFYEVYISVTELSEKNVENITK